VQVARIKPTLKAPETKRLKLTYDTLLSNFAFNFKLRRYNEGKALHYYTESHRVYPVGSCRLTQ